MKLYVNVPTSADFSTGFNATENPISEGGKWTNGETDGLDWSDVETANSNAFGEDFVDGDKSRYADPLAHLKASFRTFANDQYAEGIVHRAAGYESPPEAHEIELLLRFDITANSAQGYELLWTHEGALVVVRWNGAVGNFTALPNDVDLPDPVDGDHVRFQIIGTEMKAFVNDVLKITVSDATFASGQPGIGFWPTPGATLASYGWKSFAAGDVA